jgi:hypothetical protein
MLNRHPLGLRPPHQRTFVAFDGQQIAHHLGFAPLSRFVGQCGGIVGFAGYLAVQRGDQRITMQPCDQRECVCRFMEGDCALSTL